LLIERTSDAARQKSDSIEFVIRRRNDDDFTIHYYEPKNPLKTLTTGDYIQAHNTLYHLHELYSGEQLYQELAKRMDITGYMQWLGINTFLQNGDYNDELFVYAYPRLTANGEYQPYFWFSAWDYDDLFKPPHFGKNIPGSLVYCNENNLDEAIAKDPFLYATFKRILKDLLENRLTDASLTVLFSDIERNNKVYLSRDVVLAIQNNLPNIDNQTWDDFKTYYQCRLTFLQQRRTEIFTQLNK